MVAPPIPKPGALRSLGKFPPPVAMFALASHVLASKILLLFGKEGLVLAKFKGLEEAPLPYTPSLE